MTYRYRILSLLVSLSFSYVAFAQKLVPIDTADHKLRIELIKEYETEHKDFNHRINESTKGAFRKDKLEAYKAIQSKMIRQLRKKRFFFDERYANYIDSIVNSIVESNHQLQGRRLKILISRSSSANAFSLAEGSLIINIGLFENLQNEHQIASVICHEIAHEYSIWIL